MQSVNIGRKCQHMKGTLEMAKSDDFFNLLRSHGLRKKVAKPLAALDGNSRRTGAAGEKLARSDGR